MKILVLNGSPAKEKSTTLMLTNLFLKGLGEEAEIIDLYALKINPYNGCYACWFATNGRCVQKDDAPEVLEKLRAVGCISPQTQKILDSLLMPPEEYVETINKLFAGFKKKYHQHK